MYYFILKLLLFVKYELFIGYTFYPTVKYSLNFTKYFEPHQLTLSNPENQATFFLLCFAGLDCGECSEVLHKGFCIPIFYYYRLDSIDNFRKNNY